MTNKELQEKLKRRSDIELCCITGSDGTIIITNHELQKELKKYSDDEKVEFCSFDGIKQND